LKSNGPSLKLDYGKRVSDHSSWNLECSPTRRKKMQNLH
jgi:hypothetical protein